MSKILTENKVLGVKQPITPKVLKIKLNFNALEKYVDTYVLRKYKFYEKQLPSSDVVFLLSKLSELEAALTLAVKEAYEEDFKKCTSFVVSNTEIIFK